MRFAATVRARRFVHVYPSRAQLMDGLAQFVVSRKWRDLLVFEGPSPADAAMTAAFTHSAQKFGAQIVATSTSSPAPTRATASKTIRRC